MMKATLTKREVVKLDKMRSELYDIRGLFRWEEKDVEVWEEKDVEVQEEAGSN